MKKIFTLIVSAFIVGSAFAQYDQGNQKGYDQGGQKGYGKGNDVTYNDNKHWKDNDRFNDRFSFSKRERDMKIMQINREYDFKIESVKNRMFMNRGRKMRLIYELNDQRKDEIRRVYEKFSDRRNRFDDHDSNKNW